MRMVPTPFAVLIAAACFACGPEPAAHHPLAPPSDGSGTVGAAWRPPAPVPPTPTEAGVVPSACGVQPGAFTAPATGATLSGQAPLAVPSARAASCSGTPGTVFKVINTQATVVHSACVAGDPAAATWDTRQVPNGSYWITAQSACGCVVCAEYAYVEVTVRN
jgi:hypothetical protein